MSNNPISIQIPRSLNIKVTNKSSSPQQRNLDQQKQQSEAVNSSLLSEKNKKIEILGKENTNYFQNKKGNLLETLEQQLNHGQDQISQQSINHAISNQSSEMRSQRDKQDYVQVINNLMTKVTKLCSELEQANDTNSQVILENKELQIKYSTLQKKFADFIHQSDKTIEEIQNQNAFLKQKNEKEVLDLTNINNQLKKQISLLDEQQFNNNNNLNGKNLNNNTNKTSLIQQYEISCKEILNENQNIQNSNNNLNFLKSNYNLLPKSNNQNNYSNQINDLNQYKNNENLPYKSGGTEKQNPDKEEIKNLKEKIESLEKEFSDIKQQKVLTQEGLCSQMKNKEILNVSSDNLSVNGQQQIPIKSVSLGLGSRSMSKNSLNSQHEEGLSNKIQQFNSQLMKQQNGLNNNNNGHSNQPNQFQFSPHLHEIQHYSSNSSLQIMLYDKRNTESSLFKENQKTSLHSYFQKIQDLNQQQNKVTPTKNNNNNSASSIKNYSIVSQANQQENNTNFLTSQNHYDKNSSSHKYGYKDLTDKINQNINSILSKNNNNKTQKYNYLPSHNNQSPNSQQFQIFEDQKEKNINQLNGSQKDLFKKIDPELAAKYARSSSLKKDKSQGGITLSQQTNIINKLQTKQDFKIK